jgi:hypothetical protein
MKTADRVTIERLDEREPAVLLERWEGYAEPQPCHVELDLVTGVLTAGVGEEPHGGSVPEAVRHDRALRWELPRITAGSANRLLQAIEPLAARILAGAAIAWDGSQAVGELTEAADAARVEVERAIRAAVAAGGLEQLHELDAAEWFGEEPPEGLTADTIDYDVRVMATTAKIRAEDHHGDGHTVLVGLEEYLFAQRDALRARFDTQGEGN